MTDTTTAPDAAPSTTPASHYPQPRTPRELWELLQNPQSQAHGARHLGGGHVAAALVGAEKGLAAAVHGEQRLARVVVDELGEMEAFVTSGGTSMVSPFEEWEGEIDGKKAKFGRPGFEPLSNESTALNIEDSLLADAVGAGGVPFSVACVMFLAALFLSLKAWFKPQDKTRVEPQTDVSEGSAHPHAMALALLLILAL